jgi:hypothetical protein
MTRSGCCPAEIKRGWSPKGPTIAASLHGVDDRLRRWVDVHGMSTPMTGRQA